VLIAIDSLDDTDADSAVHLPARLIQVNDEILAVHFGREVMEVP